MKLEYYEINPGGNVTAIVPGAFSKMQKIAIAKKILRAKKHIEQVGFWTNPRSKGNAARLEMAGGEFCGNATRSLGALIARSNKKSRFRIEVAGLPDPIEVIATHMKATIGVPLRDFKHSNGVYSLPGIAHFLTTMKIDHNKAKSVLAEKNMLGRKAAGVIMYKKKIINNYAITPIVWVKDIDKLYKETACASGALALAYMVYKNFNVKHLFIKQPSTAVFETTIKDEVIWLAGPIRSIKKTSIEL